MNIIERIKQDRLERTEESLRLTGCEKCKVCGVWVDKEYVIKGICNYCIEKSEGIK